MPEEAEHVEAARAARGARARLIGSRGAVGLRTRSGPGARARVPLFGERRHVNVRGSVVLLLVFALVSLRAGGWTRTRIRSRRGEAAQRGATAQRVDRLVALRRSVHPDSDSGLDVASGYDEGVRSN